MLFYAKTLIKLQPSVPICALQLLLSTNAQAFSFFQPLLTSAFCKDIALPFPDSSILNTRREIDETLGMASEDAVSQPIAPPHPTSHFQSRL